VGEKKRTRSTKSIKTAKNEKMLRINDRELNR